MPLIKLYISGGLAIVAGAMVLLFPKLTRIALGLYLIIIGLLSFVEF